MILTCNKVTVSFACTGPFQECSSRLEVGASIYYRIQKQLFYYFSLPLFESSFMNINFFFHTHTGQDFKDIKKTKMIFYFCFVVITKRLHFNLNKVLVTATFSLAMSSAIMRPFRRMWCVRNSLCLAYNGWGTVCFIFFSHPVKNHWEGGRELSYIEGPVNSECSSTLSKWLSCLIINFTCEGAYTEPTLFYFILITGDWVHHPHLIKPHHPVTALLLKQIFKTTVFSLLLLSVFCSTKKYF